MHVYPMMDRHYQSHCMQHCEKLGGHSPPVRTFEEWKHFSEEVQHIKVEPLKFPRGIWLSATEGDKDFELSRLDHWPEGIEAVEGVWRDYYTGEELDNFAKPWESNTKGSDGEGPDSNCIYYYHNYLEVASWSEWQCWSDNMGCPCSYDTAPILYLRGLCPTTNINDNMFTYDQAGMIMIGKVSSQIEYNSTLRQWILYDSNSNITARTEASQISFALGKHNWTISGDSNACSEHKESYTIEMKLSGCSQSEFTCDDGQCVKINQRCNQAPNCRDESDEVGCQFLVLRDGYKKRVPPIILPNQALDSKTPANVKVSITLLKVVSIKEEDHSIEFQFEITLEWMEKRATYHHLNTDMYLNVLSLDDINQLWLPLVIYTNTDQLKTTRLGMEFEWATNVWVKRAGDAVISNLVVLDETEIFKGEENSLVMVQSYTHEFQCVFQLEQYPFDTQVSRH